MANKEDYEKDGLLYCGKCNTPKQFNYEGHIFPHLCECEKEEMKKQAAAEEERQHKMRIENLREKCIHNKRYYEYRFEKDDGKTSNITEIMKRYVDKFKEASERGQGILLWGSVGTGKTFYAMAIANALVDKGYSVLCTTLSKVVAMAQDFDKADDNYDYLMSQYAIVIDDLGVERSTTFATEQIYKFIDGCNTNNIPLIITTNLTPSILEKASKDSTDLTYQRIYSRILEKCYPIKINEVTRRSDKASENNAFMAELLNVPKRNN